MPCKDPGRRFVRAGSHGPWRRLARALELPAPEVRPSKAAPAGRGLGGTRKGEAPALSTLRFVLIYVVAIVAVSSRLMAGVEFGEVTSGGERCKVSFTAEGVPGRIKV